MTKDQAFAARMEALVERYRTGAGSVGIRVDGDVGGSIVVGEGNQLIDRNSGTIRIGAPDTD